MLVGLAVHVVCLIGARIIKTGEEYRAATQVDAIVSDAAKQIADALDGVHVADRLEQIIGAIVEHVVVWADDAVVDFDSGGVGARLENIFGQNVPRISQRQAYLLQQVADGGGAGALDGVEV